MKRKARLGGRTDVVGPMSINAQLRPHCRVPNDRKVRIAAGRDCTAKNAGNICQVANTSGLPQLVTAQGLGSGATFQKRTLPPPRLARQNSHAFAS